MSASDKKQQRKAEMTEGLTQKQRKELNEAQAAKRQKTIYKVVGGICAVAAVALLVWNNSGVLNRYSTAATVDGVNYKVPDLQYYYVQARNIQYQYYQMYAAYGITLGYDPYTDDGEQYYSETDGTTYADYFRESALDNLKQVAALCSAAKADGYTLSADGQAQIDDQLAQIDVVCAKNGLTRSSYFAQVYGNGVTEKVFVRNLTNDVLASEYSQYHQDNISYSDDALNEYYQENADSLDSYDYRIFSISGVASDPVDENGDPVVDSDGNTVTATDEEQEAAMAEAKEKADAAVAEIQAASDREAAFIAAAPNYVSEDYKGAYADESYSLNEGVMGSTLTQNSSSIASWLMDSSRKKGDVTAIESSSGYFVVLYLNRYLNQTNTVDIRHILVLADTTDSTETDDSGNAIPTQEALDAAKAQAQDILDQWKSGEATAESFGELAEEYSEDPGSNTNGGQYTSVYQGQMFAGFDSWIFDSSRQSGDTGLVENTQSGQQGWHVIYFEGLNEPYWKSVAISAKQSDDQSAWLTELTDSVEAVAADGMKHVGSKNNVAPVESEAVSESEAVTDEAATESEAAG
jgi:hypothetical protein